MSLYRKIKINCPKCGQEIDYDYWKSVNVDLNLELKDKVLNQDLFRCHCSCGCNDVLLHSLLYHNMEKKYMVSFYDISEVEDVKSSFEEIKEDIDERFRITTDYNDFTNKINIFDSGFDDKLIEIQKYIAYEGIKKKGKDIRNKITIFSAPDEDYEDYHLKILDLSTPEDDENFIFPIQRDWFEKHTQLITFKEKNIDDVFYVIDQTWANLIAGNGYYHEKNGYLRIIKSYQNEVRQKYKIDYNKEDINKIENGDTLLILAVIANDYNRVKELLEKGADPNLRIDENRIALHYALQYGASKEIIDLLVEHGSELNVVARHKLTPLDIIDANCSVEYLDHVFSLGAECNKEHLIKHFASQTHNIDLITYLVKKGCSLDYRDSNDMNVTCEIICNNMDNNLLNYYLDLYGNPNEKYRGTPCLFDDIEGYDDVQRVNGYYAKRLQILFDHGADVNITDCKNRTPMMIACKYAHDEYTIRFLLKYKPDLSATDKDGYDIFYYLDKNEYLSDFAKEEIRQLLLSV